MTAFAIFAMQAAAATAPLAPAGKWKIEYADAMCVLQREFGKGREQVTFAVKPNGLRGESVMLVLLWQESGATAYRTGQFDFGIGGEKIRVDYARFHIAAQGKAMLRFSLNGPNIERFWRSSQVTFWIDGAAKPLMLGSLAKAEAALATCQTDLLVGFGIPKAELDAVAHPAESIDPASWITHQDYPVEALRLKKQGEVMIAWRIDATGRIGECRTIRSSRFEPLDRASCSALRARGRYLPARDAAGKPVPSWGLRRVVWRLPG